MGWKKKIVICSTLSGWRLTALQREFSREGIHFAPRSTIICLFVCLLVYGERVDCSAIGRHKSSAQYTDSPFCTKPFLVCLMKSNNLFTSRNSVFNYR